MTQRPSMKSGIAHAGTLEHLAQLDLRETSVDHALPKVGRQLEVPVPPLGPAAQRASHWSHRHPSGTVRSLEGMAIAGWRAFSRCKSAVPREAPRRLHWTVA